MKKVQEILEKPLMTESPVEGEEENIKEESLLSRSNFPNFQVVKASSPKFSLAHNAFEYFKKH